MRTRILQLTALAVLTITFNMAGTSIIMSSFGAKYWLVCPMAVTGAFALAAYSFQKDDEDVPSPAKKVMHFFVGLVIGAILTFPFISEIREIQGNYIPENQLPKEVLLEQDKLRQQVSLAILHKEDSIDITEVNNRRDAVQQGFANGYDLSIEDGKIFLKKKSK